MRPRLKHLCHPIHTFGVAQSLIARKWEMWRFVERGERHFAGDSRYSSHSVIDGFKNRLLLNPPDRTMLERICDLYQKAIQLEEHAPAIYRPTTWWELQRQSSLRPVMNALATRDVETLGRMYQNFYRDPCSAGLVVSQDSAKAYFGESISELQRRAYLVEALHRIDIWKGKTDARFRLCELEGPGIGNPFGVRVEGALVTVGADYQHYCAHKIMELLDSEAAVVAEIGGGFGGMAYFLLRDRPQTTYVNFDLPESIALSSFYLLTAFPQLKFLLYGERELTAEAISSADVVLMPVSMLHAVPPKFADLTFSSHSMSDLSREAMAGYLKDIVRMTRRNFVCIGNGAAATAMSDIIRSQFPELKSTRTEPSNWHSHRYRGISEVECTYQVFPERRAL